MIKKKVIKKNTNKTKHKKSIKSDDKFKKVEKNLNKKFKISKKLAYFIIGILFLGLVVITAINYINNMDNVPSNGDQLVNTGDMIGVWYTGRLQSGKVFDTNVKSIAEENNMSKPSYSPLEFIVGSGMMIKGFDEGVLGMALGEKKTITLSPDEAYGTYRADYVENIPLDDFEEMIGLSGDEIVEGMEIFALIEGRQVPAKIKKVGINFVSIDFNHELAGKTLIFDIEIHSINN
jgi:FKBP-type peptidyl-prolyl cis-trans isomerase 2